MKHMKRLLPLFLALCLALSACGGKPAGGQSDPKALEEAYVQAITDARSQEENDAFPFIPSDDEMYQPVLELMGLNQDDVTASSVVVSLRGVQAYAIVAAMPAQGKTEAVKSALQGFVDQQKSNFEFYLEDQFEIASHAKLDTLKDGTVLLVMCDGQDQVFESIRSKLEK